MSVIYKFLFPSKPDGTAMSLLILALRILFGILLMSHGVQKWANYDVMSVTILFSATTILSAVFQPIK